MKKDLTPITTLGIYVWWKPELNPVKQLAKAGALIAAEIDRIQQRG